MGMSDMSTRDARCAAGLCTACGERAPGRGYLTCETCRATNAQRLARHNARKADLARELKAAHPDWSIERIGDACGLSRGSVWQALGGKRKSRAGQGGYSRWSLRKDWVQPDNRCPDCAQPKSPGVARCKPCQRIADKRSRLASGVVTVALCESCFDRPRVADRLRCESCERARLTARRYVEVA